MKDHGYDTQTGIQLYSSIHNDVLAIEQTIGSPINTGLLPAVRRRPHGQHPGRLGPVAHREPARSRVVGATYEVEMINVLDYLLKEGKIKEGDKIGHIYFEGEYGAGGLAGSKYFAKQHGMTVVEQQIQSDRHGHDRPGHQAQGRGGQGDRAHRGAGPDGLGRRRGRRPGPRRADRWATTRSSPRPCSTGPRARR